MIGSREYAEELAEWDFSNSDFPSGWFYIGEGCQRLCLIAPDGVLYKKEKPGEHCSNEDEFINYIRMRNTTIKGWRLPETSMYLIGYEPIIAMEYIEGEFDTECQRYGRGYNQPCSCGKIPCTAWEWEKPQSLWNIIDLSDTNVLVQENGVRVVVDIVA